ncbi:hypothetical protein HO173_001847 [Letharia columbiana]|uniref:N-acetyltransferase domain-containing protein n=1 Tax=Letharia columbiana TaxID=112416 RepID=A0A8H6L997_9LECA|nr:uncharacterized protein HO173_001847 [Letharia columbiana]KAF6240236.1 hypothetical protein HO173_001847 [Letharia columbiana]
MQNLPLRPGPATTSPPPDIEIWKAVPSDVTPMADLFLDKYGGDKATRLMYTTSEVWPTILDTIESYIDFEREVRFMIAMDIDTRIPVGLISVGVVPDGVHVDDYTGSELSVYANWAMRAERASARGEDPRRLTDARLGLSDVVDNRSRAGQDRYIGRSHLVLNTFAADLEGSTGQIYQSLLTWAINFAQIRNWPIWAQFPARHVGPLVRAGFVRVGGFSLDLDEFAPRRAGLGVEEYVQMVYRNPRGRSNVRMEDLRGHRSGRGRRESF